MLRVMRAPEEGRYNNKYWVSVSLGSMTWYFQPLIGPFSPLNGNWSECSLSSSIDGILWPSSDKDRVGDRAVRHHQISGELTFYPFSRVRKVSSSIFPVYEITHSTGSVQTFTHYVRPGTEFYYEYVVPSGASKGAKLHWLAKADSKTRTWVCGTGTTTPFGQFSGSLKTYELKETGLKVGEKRLSYSSFDVWRSGPFATMTTATWTNALLIKPPTVGISDNAIAMALGVIKDSAYNNFMPSLVPSEPFIWSDLAQSCIDQIRYTDVNTLSYVAELREIKSLGEALMGVLSKNPKKIAKGYLAFHYGATLTVKDTMALGEAIIQAKKSLKDLKPWKETRGSRTFTGMIGPYPYRDTYHYKVCTQPQEMLGMEAVRLLDRWGFYPTPQRLWDMIPLSFVVDWFVEVSDFLGRVDSDLLRGFYKILSVCWSRKVEVDLTPSVLFPNMNVGGFVTATEYVRALAKELHPIAFRIERAGEFHNYLEGLALIIAKRK